MAKTRKQYRNTQKGGFWDTLNNWWTGTTQKTKEVASNAGQTITNWSDQVANKTKEITHNTGEFLNKDVSIRTDVNNTQQPYYQSSTHPVFIGGKKKSQKRRKTYKKSKSHMKKTNKK